MATKPERHALFGGSTAGIWTVCTGAPALWKQCPEQAASEVMLSGTLCHGLAARYLQNEHVDAHELDGLEQGEQESIDTYVEYVNQRRAAKVAGAIDVSIAIEREWQINDEMFGSADCVIKWVSVDTENRWHIEALEIIDYKHGQGHAVTAEDNVQLAFYACCVMRELGVPARLKLTIVQPRIDTRAPIQNWTITDPHAFYVHWLAKFEAAYEQATDVPAYLVTGDHCQWCRAKAICPEQHKVALEVARMDFEDGLATISIDQLAHVLNVGDRVVAFVKACKEHAIKLAAEGAQLPGWRIEEKLGHRRWRDEAAVLERLQAIWPRAEVTKTTTLSPNQVESLAKKLDRDRRKALLAELGELTERPNIGLQLVKDDGRAEQLKQEIIKQFAN